MTVFYVAGIECDGCAATYQHSPTGPSTAAQIRRLAVVAGWTFPARIKMDGTPGATFNDVCPACSPTWVRRTAPNPWRPWAADKRYTPVQSPDGT